MEEAHAPKPKRRLLLLVAAIVACVLLIAGAGAIYYLSRTRLHIPDSVTTGVHFPLYVPKKLPTGYAVDTASFQYVPTEGVFVFQAKDDAGDTIVFSEQSKPSSVDFNDFADKQLIESRKLPNLPFSTAVGKTLDKQTTLMSIVTPATWIVTTTQAELSNQQLHDVAAGLTKY
jgi:hypothetical protein